MKDDIVTQRMVDTTRILETISHPNWIINGWHISFQLSEKHFQRVKQISDLEKWHEDPLVIQTCVDQLETGYKHINKLYRTIGRLPQVGDRLADEESGLLIEERVINGQLQVICFRVSC